MTHAINSSTKLLSIDITKNAHTQMIKELKRQRLKKEKKKGGIKEKKR